MRVRVIVNPIAGRGRGRGAGRDLAAALEARGVDVDLRETARAGDGGRLASDVAGLDACLAIGGDGSFHDMLNGLPDAGALPVGVFPLGTGNVLAKDLRLPRTPDGLAGLVAEGRTRTLDLGIANEGRRFLLVATAGFDAWTLEALHRARRGPIHMSQYAFLGMKLLVNYQPWHMRVKVDGRVVACNVSQFAVTNVASFGGPMQILPSARPDDGVFDVFCLRGHGRRDIIRYFASAFFRRTERMGGSLVTRGSHVEVETVGDACPIQIDGEPYGTTPAVFRIVPRAVRVFAPA